MARSKRKRKLDIQHKNEAKQFWRVVGIVTLVLLIVLFFVFNG